MPSPVFHSPVQQHKKLDVHAKNIQLFKLDLMGSGGKGERNIPGLVSFIMFLMSLGWTGAILLFCFCYGGENGLEQTGVLENARPSCCFLSLLAQKDSLLYLEEFQGSNFKPKSLFIHTGHINYRSY